MLRPRLLSLTSVALAAVLAVGVPALADPAAPSLDRAATTTSTGPTDPIDTTDRDAVVRAYQDRWLPLLDVPLGWTGGDVATCTAGTTTQRSQQAVLDAVNYLRAQAGLPPVVLEPAWGPAAQQAALMMHAEGRLSHHPEPDWACWTEDGATAAGKSNLYLGVTGVPAMAGYINDPGAHNGATGHRTWIFDDRLTRIGTGSTSRANALWVVDERMWDTEPAGVVVTWPSAGHFPAPMLPSSRRWSLTLSKSDARDLSGATVTTSVAGGPEQSRPIEHSGRRHLVFTAPDGLQRSGDLVVTVRVSGITTEAGPAPDHEYDVVLVDPDSPTSPTPTATATNSPTASPTSSPTSSPSAAPPTADGVPVIAGRPRVRKRVTLVLPTFDPQEADLTITWWRSGTLLPRRTGERIRLTRKDRGHRIHAEVTATVTSGPREGSVTVRSRSVKVRR